LGYKKIEKMRKIKFLVASVLFCAMGYTGYTAYEKMTMSEAEKFMKANIEALTLGEPTPAGSCARRSGISGSKYEERMFCDARTDGSTIYPCPTTASLDYYREGNMDRCTR